MEMRLKVVYGFEKNRNGSEVVLLTLTDFIIGNVFLARAFEIA